MSVSFLRGVEYGMELYLKVYIVKAGQNKCQRADDLTPPPYQYSTFQNLVYIK